MKLELKRAVPYSFLYEHLLEQKKKDRMLYKKPKEILFCGQANSGKSSMINALYNTNKLCRVSKHAVIHQLTKSGMYTKPKLF